MSDPDSPAIDSHSSASDSGKPRELQVNYLPRDPADYRPEIGLIGCGGITVEHLAAYRKAGYRVTALCDVNLAAARKRQAEFYPDAQLFEDYQDLLRSDAIEVVDIATHTYIRPPIVRAALEAGKHVLSQKPFVLDLDEGERLVELANRLNLQLAVNQNGRWAPHFSYIRNAIQQGLLGELFVAHCSVHWDHGWIRGLEFENIDDLILYDYAIHWFDFVCSIFGDRQAKSVFSTRSRAAGQQVRPPLLGQSIVVIDDAQVSLVFDGSVPFLQQDETYVAGTAGTICSVGPENSEQKLTIETAQGRFQPELVGRWFPDGFHGTMGELLCSIEERRSCSINAAENLKSLALCFAAVASSHRGTPVNVGSVRTL
jgi:predicted dehydrogenase